MDRLMELIKIGSVVVGLTVYVVTTRDQQTSDHATIVKLTEAVEKLTILEVGMDKRIDLQEKDLDRLLAKTYGNVHGATQLQNHD